jgi:hypothetical protein
MKGVKKFRSFIKSIKDLIKEKNIYWMFFILKVKN